MSDHPRLAYLTAVVMLLLSCAAALAFVAVSSALLTPLLPSVTLQTGIGLLLMVPAFGVFFVVLACFDRLLRRF